MELLVVVVVCAVLMALLLPAVQQAREAARRAACRNQLRQLSLASQNFHDAENALPSLDLGRTWATWAVLILPYIDQPALYDRWNLRLRYHRQASESGMDLALFHCPSRVLPKCGPLGDRKLFSDGLYLGPPGWSDYGICAGTSRNLNNGAGVRADDATTATTANLPMNPSDCVHPGWKHRVSLEHLARDGASNTLLFGEMHIPSGAKLNVVFNSDSQPAYSRVAGHDGPQKASGDYALEFPIVAEPNYMGPGWFERFGSAHGHVCHFSLADGTVRGISMSIELETLHRLANSCDGLVIGEY